MSSLFRSIARVQAKGRAVLCSTRHFDQCQLRLIGSVVSADDISVPEFSVKNEPILGYLKGSQERKELDAALEKYWNQVEEIPIVIDGERFKTGEKMEIRCPFEHKKVLATFYRADPFHLQKAIDAAMRARKDWDARPLKDRIDIFMKAADLCAGKYRQVLNATTMLGQGKTMYQAEIDSACELADFYRFNAFYAKELVNTWQPISTNPKETKNSMRFRGLEGFVAGISPFNFTAIGGNLGASPAIMGNVILWKPAETALLSNWIIFNILEEAGIPPGVINFVPADGPFFGRAVTDSPHLAAINFTGSVPTWRWLVRAVGTKIEKYTNYPRLMGECGGKNFHLVHPSADFDTVVAGTIRSAFEYGGQKCSACSRLYVPQSVWPKLKEALVEEIKKLKVGDPRDPKTFYSAVIDKSAFRRIKDYINYSKATHRVIAGGKSDDHTGYYVHPMIVEIDNSKDKMLNEEIFGPVLAVYEFPDKMLQKDIFGLIENVPFGLTGAVFAQDEAYLRSAFNELKDAAGNFYINDKSTGAVVGQQPFGGTRLSGTNDKPGGLHYMLRWTTPQAVKETFVPMRDVDYPYMRE